MPSDLAKAAFRVLAEEIVSEVLRYDKLRMSTLAMHERVAAIIDSDLATVREALEQIRGEGFAIPDADGLIVDAVCVYCDQNSVDGCTEDCPRSIAEAALARLEVKA